MFAVVAVFLASNYGKQIVFLHYAKHCLGILMDALSFKPYMDSTVAISAVAMLLTLPDLFGKRKIPCRYIHSLDIVIVTTS